MRLYLVPISTGRSLLYCKRVETQAAKQLSRIDKITDKASATWAKWEEADGGWKKSLVLYGNRVLQRIPYEEWGLKSVPPLSTRRETEELKAHTPVDLVYPKNVIKESKVLGLLRQLATERQSLHRRRMWWSIIIAPLTAPIALIPVIPNIPFFYFVYRGWSHWRALSGSQHLCFLLDNNLINPCSLPALEQHYAQNPVLNSERITEIKDEKDEHGSPEADRQGENPVDGLLLKESDGKKLAKILGPPELAMEVERAVGQVKHLLKEKKNL
ncbi:hypothetical protein FQN55_000256 [Onygenales sp. PD_40]|nr:hypothetical protein FQN55_000256 [Onygenales sp. PD_40]KAK2795731.1 hypothetical protein FQN52_003580 [Onygenales sp. PD_12]KAK2801443.1 hypothetical protein FQN51_005337 [Onygenales sp. PD_10]